MTTAEAALDAVAPSRPPASQWRMALRRLLRKRIAASALCLILIFYGVGVLAPLIAPHSYDQIDLNHTFAGPSLRHPLGTDRLGRDVLSRVIWASRTTVVVTVATLVTGGLVLGVGLGLLAGYKGGGWDTITMRVGDVFLALPGLLMLIMISATLRPRWDGWMTHFYGWPIIGGTLKSGASDYFLVFGVLSLFSWVGMARVIRSQVFALRQTEYVQAAVAMGAGTGHVVWRHLLPNVSNLIVVVLSASLASVAGSEIALTWLGVGVRPPTPSFGQLLFDGAGLSNLRTHPNLLLVPAGVLVVLFLSFNLLGDAVNDVLNPRTG